MKKSIESFKNAKNYSCKIDSYFSSFDDILFRVISLNQPIVFVEIGVRDGGGLEMWKDYLPEGSRIIGIDNNPTAKYFESDQFEIFIGDQADEKFWNNFFLKVGNVDIIVDDGGHTNMQQLKTLLLTINHINDGGMLITEDTHASYLQTFSNPSKYSFIRYAYNLVDRMNYRYSLLSLKNNYLDLPIYRISFFESICVFYKDKNRSNISHLVDNGGISINAEDLRFKNDKIEKIKAKFFYLKYIPFLKNLVSYLLKKKGILENIKMKKYFK